MIRDALILEALRTPIGRIRGGLSGTRCDDLLAHTYTALLARTKIDPASIDDVSTGCANQAGEDNRNVARMAALLAGIPQEVPALTLNRLCASGMDSVIHASRGIALGEVDVAVASGVEGMSRAPYVMAKAARAYPTGAPEVFDTSIGWRFSNPRMAALFPLESMGETAENIVERYGISREDQDAFALESHRRAVEAMDAGAFRDEIAPVITRKGTVDADEGPRRDTHAEKLASLSPAFRKGGSVTAGNSSTLNDGAAAVLLASSAGAERLGLKPLARIRSSAVVGVDPRFMGMGPVPAVRKALERAGLSLADVGLVELNEAFAAQALGVMRELELDPARTNVHGGAIALGHPLGCTGARLIGTLARNLKARGVQYGVATLCVGVGQGAAVVLEACP